MSRVPRGAVSVLNRLVLPAVIPAGQCSDRVRREIQEVSFAAGNESLIQLVDRPQEDSKSQGPQEVLLLGPTAFVEAARDEPSEHEILAEVRKLVPDLDAAGRRLEILNRGCTQNDRGPGENRNPARNSKSRSVSIDGALFDWNCSNSPLQELGKLSPEFGEVKRVISLSTTKHCD